MGDKWDDNFWRFLYIFGTILMIILSSAVAASTVAKVYELKALEKAIENGNPIMLQNPCGK